MAVLDYFAPNDGHLSNFSLQINIRKNERRMYTADNLDSTVPS